MANEDLDLSNGSWILAYQTRKVSNREFQPHIDPFYVTATFQDRFVIICTESEHVDSQYYRCAFLTQRTTIPGISSGSQSQKVDLKNVVIPVNRCSLLQLDYYSKQYQFLFTPVDYIKGFSLSIYTYQPPS